MKKIIKYITVFLIMIIMFCTILTLTSAIPKQFIEKKVNESAEILTQQKDMFFVLIRFKKIYMLFDNYTDALMINTAYSINSKTPFYSAIVARKNYIDGTTEVIHKDEVGELKSDSKYEELTQVGDLNDTLNNNTKESFEYARYWHGYLILLRPLLIFFNITQIRIISYVILACLALVLLYKICKKIDIPTAVIFLIGLIICDYFFIGLSLQGTPVFLITMIASIIILDRDIKDKSLLFLIIGGLTAFFDFLTVPIITLGIPLIVNIMKTKNDHLSENFKTIFMCCLMWGIGYLGVFLSKWIIADILFKKALIVTSFEQLKYRTVSNNSDKPIKLFGVFALNFKIVMQQFFIGLLITELITENKFAISRGNIKLNFRKLFLYLIIGSLGIVWFIVLKQHSFKHSYFTYRNFFLISVGLMLGIYNLFERGKDDKNNKE